ncbi:MAG: flagellar biosynthetic protein FliR [Acidobacteria bacterium]|nr:flagellar biosynthetic protein FliR [Acidobacteriota bacterium]
MLNEILPAQEKLLSFLLVLARVSGAVAFLPIPGWRRSPEATRIVLALSLTVALVPACPKPPHLNPGLGELAVWVIQDLGWGVFLGLTVNLLVEGFVLAAQCIGLQAGFSYASTIDPGSEADSTVLQVFAQLAANLLFFAFRMDAELIRALANSFSLHQPGAWTLQWNTFSQVAELGAEVWRTALRLSIPILALLLMLDLAVALYGKVQAQVQLTTLSFPIKIVMALASLAVFAAAMPGVFRAQMDRWVAMAMR